VLATPFVNRFVPLEQPQSCAMLRSRVMRATDSHEFTRNLFLVALAVVATVSVAHAQQNASSAVYRYRAAIAALMQLKPGMTVAEVGTTQSVIGSELLALVGSGGRVISAPVDQVGVTKLEPASVDAVALLSALATVLEPKTLFDGLARAVKPGGVLVVVDVPQENDGKRVIGLEAEDVVTLATAAGFKREAESGIVPGHYAIRFRK
jgi:predicted methyltransferase